MKTYPEQARKAIEHPSGRPVVLHPLVRPFERENTKMWHEREEIRDAIEDLLNAADEAMLCLEACEELQARLKQASDAFYDAEKAIRRLWPNDALHPVVRELALDLLRDCFEDEIAHLTLRMIRDAQAPRFEALKESHPEIYRDFMAARNGPHEALLRNRRKRVEALTALVEGKRPGSPDGSLATETRKPGSLK